jgi:YVTN family beta-propeller protein
MAVWAEHEATELPIGANFAGYRIEGVAGEGRMGVVYRATHPGLGRVVALKLIARELSDSYAFRQTFRADSQRAAAIGLLAQSGAPLIYERGETAGRLFVVMRYVPGSDLGTLIGRDGPLGTRRAVAVVRDVAAALDAGHRRGIVHRDVKPGHVLLANEPDAPACLIDFGVTPVGASSPDYRSPEQTVGEPADARSDVYALGCLLFHALTGLPPSERGAGATGIPPALAAVIARATSTSPAARYASAGELAAAAAAALPREVPPPPEPPLVVHGGAAPRGPRRRLVARVALAAALFAAILGALASIGGIDRGNDAQRAVASATRVASAGAGTDAGSPTVVSTIAVGKSADGLAVADGEVWVADPRAGALVRIDARTDRVTARSHAGADPDSVAAGAGMAWITTRGDGHLRRFAAERDPSPAGARDVGGKPEGIALGRKVAWVVSSVDDTVRRVDRGSGSAVGSPIHVGAQPIDVAVGPSGVWTANSADGTVSHIDADTGRVVGEATRVGREPKGVIEALGSVWVADNGSDTVTRIDPRTGRVTATIEVGDQPSKLAVAAGQVWVTNFGDGTVSRIDPRSGRVVGPAVGVGRRPVGIAFGAGHLWVASLSDGTVTKIRL